MEVREGIEPSYSGFADRRVTTSPPRHLIHWLQEETEKTKAREQELSGPFRALRSLELKIR